MPGPKSKQRREADATRPVRTVFLKRGASTALHHHTEACAWTQVVSGEILDERWHRDDLGHLIHERRVLRENQALAAPVDWLHRVRALTDTVFVTTRIDGCGAARSVGAHAAEAARHAHDHGDRSALVTAVGRVV